MSGAFDQCLRIEADGRPLAEWWLERTFPAWWFNGDKGTQEQTGDYWCKTVDGRTERVELKVERRNTGNLFLETWSNHPVSPGWLHTSPSGVLLYVFLDTSTVMACRFHELRAWARENLERFEEKQQKQYSQPNDSRGVCVPWYVLAVELGRFSFETYRAPQLGDGRG